MYGNNDLLTLQRNVDRLFQDAVSRMVRPEGGTGNGTRSDYNGQYLIPLADAWENEDEVFIEMALPGVNGEDVDITFERDTVTISGTFQSQHEGGQRILREIPRGQFRRRFTLQVPVDVDRVEANYHNGLLSLRLPKSEDVKPRKISVQKA
jgi:HSP20 family protein